MHRVANVVLGLIFLLAVLVILVWMAEAITNPDDSDGRTPGSYDRFAE